MDLPTIADLSVLHHGIHAADGGQLVAVELLSRFQGRPDVAAVFAQAEQANRVMELDRVCLRAVLREARLLHKALRAHVNAFPQSLTDAGILNVLGSEAARTNGPRIVLELHESRGVQAVAAQVQELRSHGLLMAVDDVGAPGTLLTDLLAQVDFVKIDRCMVERVDCDAGSRRTLARLVLMIRALGQCCIIAEGVENATHLQVVKDLGLEEAQGFYFGRPAQRPYAAA